MQETSKYKVWKKALIASSFWLAIFISSLMGALYVSGIFAEKTMKDWLFYHDRRDDLEEQHSQYLLYAMFATELKALADKKDYDAILNKTCWLLLISTPKLAPEVWDESSSRRAQDEKFKKDAQESIESLFESGHCSPYTREDLDYRISK